MKDESTGSNRRAVICSNPSGIMAALYYYPGTLAGYMSEVVRPQMQWMFRLSLSAAYTSLIFLGVSLLIGPWNVLRGRANPVSTHLRRDIGIWAAVYSIVHVLIAIQEHVPEIVYNFITPPWVNNPVPLIPIRLGIFGFGNYTGLGVLFIVVMLLLLSNDFSLGRLGAKSWKSLQRWNYVGFGLLVLHSIAYIFMEKRFHTMILFFAGVVLLVLVAQILGFRKIRNDRAGARKGFNE